MIKIENNNNFFNHLFYNYSSYAERTGKMRNFREAIRPMWPFLTFLVLLMIWPYISPNDIMEKDPRILFMLSGTIFSNISVSLPVFFFFFGFFIFVFNLIFSVLILNNYKLLSGGLILLSDFSYQLISSLM